MMLTTYLLKPISRQAEVIRGSKQILALDIARLQQGLDQRLEGACVLWKGRIKGCNSC